jgi:cytoskeletal protein CcmA (bactofilin family)
MNGNEIQLSSSGFELSDKAGNSITSGPQGLTLAGTNVIIGGNLQLGGTIQGSGGGEYAGTIKTSGSVQAGGNVSANGDVTAGAISVTNHVHTGVTTGSSNTGPATG